MVSVYTITEIVAGFVIFVVFFFALKPRFWKPKRDIVVIHLLNRRFAYLKYVKFPEAKITRDCPDGTTEIYYYGPEDIYDDDIAKLFRTKHFRYIDVYQGNPFAQSHRKKSYWLEWQKLDSAIDTDQTLMTLGGGNKEGFISTQMAGMIAVMLSGLVGLAAFMIGYIHP